MFRVLDYTAMPIVEKYTFPRNYTGCPTKHIPHGFLGFLIFLIVKDNNCGHFLKAHEIVEKKFLYLKKQPRYQ